MAMVDWGSYGLHQDKANRRRRYLYHSVIMVPVSTCQACRHYCDRGKVDGSR